VHRFTRGQRKGLGVALGYPAFVTRIDPTTAEVTVGRYDEACASGVRLGRGRWDDDVPFDREVVVRVRSQHGGALGRLEGSGPLGGSSGALREPSETGPLVRAVQFAEPVAGVSPGQVAVAYDGDRLLGGATIEEVVLERSS
jgi:tRNA-specific 2-thiouridylase